MYRKVFELVGGFRREDIVDIMVFKLSDVMFVYFRNVDFNYVIKGIVLGCYVRFILSRG